MSQDVYLSLRELEMFFQDLAITMLGLGDLRSKWVSAHSTWDSSTEEGRSVWDDADLVSNPYYLVRIAWQNAPSAKYGEDVCHIRATEWDSPYNRQRHIVVQALDDVSVNIQTSYTRVLDIGFVLYGPRAYDNASKLRDAIFYQPNKLAAAEQNIYLIPDIPAPRRIPELFQGQWWERADLSIRFNNLVVRNFAVPAIEAVNIIVNDHNGIIRTIEMEEIKRGASAFTDTTGSQWEGSQGSGFETP